MVKDNLLRIYNQFTQLDSNKVSLVTYDPNWNHFAYLQDNRTVVVTSLANFIIPPNRFKYAVLTPNGYADLMSQLTSLISNDLVNDDYSLLTPDELKFNIYQSKTSKLFPYPVKIASMKICDITNRFIINFMFKIMYKSFNNPLIAYKKSLKDRSKTI